MELPRVGRTSNARERLLEAMRELIWTGSYGSTSVDQICLRAGVKKGSFYHFFESKSALALSAIDFGWSEYRVKLDALINSEMSPLERLLAGFRDQRIQQRTMQERHGRVLGCPIHSLGCEVATTDPVLCDRLQKILTEILHYYETTIREGQEEGLIVRVMRPNLLVWFSLLHRASCSVLGLRTISVLSTTWKPELFCCFPPRIRPPLIFMIPAWRLRLAER